MMFRFLKKFDLIYHIVDKIEDWYYDFQNAVFWGWKFRKVRNFDYSYVYTLLYIFMKENYKVLDKGYGVFHPNHRRKMLEAIELLRKLDEHDYYALPDDSRTDKKSLMTLLSKQAAQRSYDINRLYSLLAKYGDNWWD